MRARRIVALVTLAVPVVLVGWFVVEPLPRTDELALNPDRLPVAETGAKAPSRLPMAEPGVEGSIERLVRAVMGREAQGGEFDQLVPRYRDGEPLSAIADSLTALPPFTVAYGSTTDTAYVERLYKKVLGRQPTAADVDSWTGELAGGRSRSAVLIAFSESAEFVAATHTPAPVSPRPLLAPSGVEHSIARAYLGLAGRWPGRAEFDDSVTRYLAGAPLATIVGAILATPEVAARYGATNEGFVTRLFADVLGRAAQPGDIAHWRERLDAGESRASVAAVLTESSEMVTRTRTAAPAPVPIRHVLVALGDSVMLGAVARIQEITGWTVHVDARGCRQPTTTGSGCGDVNIPSGVAALRSARERGELGGAVAIQMGNNGPMSDQQFEAMMAEVADQRLVLFLTLHEPRAFEAPNNAVIANGVARWPNTRLIDWHGAASGHDEWFSDGEGIHLSYVGAQAMADLIAAALPA